MQGSIKTGITIFGLLTGLATGCGQKPSFEDVTYEEFQSEDATARNRGRIDEHGTVIANGQAGAKPKPVDPNADSTANDPEPKNEGGTDQGPNSNQPGSPGSDIDPNTPDPTLPDDPEGDDGRGGNDGVTPPGDVDDPEGDDGVSRPVPNDPGYVTREMDFDSDVIGSSSVSLALDDPYMTQDLDFQRSYSESRKVTRQNSRKSWADEFTQGHPGSKVTEEFDQEVDRKLDLLVVVDNSGSMEEEQANLSTKLQPLLSYVADSDWQIGFVTTDPSQHCLRELIRKGDGNIAQKFQSAVQAGIDNSNNERGVLTSVRSLSGSCLKRPWIRPDSTLAVLVVSDEDNCSDGTMCPGKAYASGNYLYDHLAGIREPGKNARIYGLIWHPSQSQSECSTGYNKANIWANLIDRTNGTWGSICDSDYSKTLREVSKNISVILEDRFTLKQVPDAGTLKVHVNGIAQPSGWMLTGKVLEFVVPPEEGSNVTVEYSYGAAPIYRRFNLVHKPSPGNIQVLVNNVEASSSDYTVDYSNPSVTFANPPADRSAIRVNYKGELNLLDSWDLEEEVKAGSLGITVNNVENLDFVVDEVTGRVTFDMPPPEDALISFSWIAVGQPILTYPFVLGGVDPNSVSVSDRDSGLPVAFDYVNSQLMFAASDFVEGRRIEVRFANAARQMFEVELPTSPIAGRVLAEGGGVTCDTSPKLQISGRRVIVRNCGFPASTVKVKVDYDYVISSKSSFSFDVSDFPAPDDYQVWTVSVDGVATDSYTRIGKVISFSDPLPIGASIKVRLVQIAG